MNEEAIRDAYNLFEATGYNKSYEDFRALINSNPEALQDAYGLFTATGYNKDIESFKSLMGVGGAMPQEEVKKKDESIVEKAQGVLAGTTDLPSAVSSLDWSPSFLETIEQKPWEKNFVRRLYGSDYNGQFITDVATPLVTQDESNINVDYSTHKMASAEVDGKYIAYPTIVQKKGQGNLTQLSDAEALEYALQNNEYLSFPTQYQAQAYAEGEYKRGTLLEDRSRPDFFNTAINMITPEFIDRTEEAVVPQMNYQFGPLGFKFEESGMTGDWMIATAPNGQTKEFSLDPAFGLGAESTSEELKKWIKDNSPINGLESLESQYTAENKKFASQAEVDAEYEKINSQADKFKNEVSTFLREKNDTENEMKKLDALPIDERNSPENVAKYKQLLDKKMGLQDVYQKLVLHKHKLRSVI